MSSLRQQRTLQSSVVVSGRGYWTGLDVRVEFHPSPPNSGVTFTRVDLRPESKIPVAIGQRVETPRRTTLRNGSATVEMVEHILAALAGLRIDNCDVRVNNPEMPGCDGSSKAFVEALDAAGCVTQEAPRALLRVREITRLCDGDSWIEARPAPQGGLSLRYRLDYGTGTAIGRQTLAIQLTPESFRRDLAPSRTFMLKQEADWLRAQGLAAHATVKDLLVFDHEGPIENELRYPDECVRHKLLDLVGDLALAGYDIEGQIIAHKSGHRLNAELVRAILLEGEKINSWRRSA